MTSERPTAVPPPNTPASRASDGPPSAATSGFLLVSLLIVVAALVAFVHWPALDAQADYFDDGMYLGENRLVQNPSWDNMGTFLTEILQPSTVDGYYQPLAMISLAIDTALGGKPDTYLPYHRTSLILHVVNTLLVVVLLYLLFANAWVAAGVGLLFGIHPLMVEPIPWISERKTLLAAFFAFSCLILYVLYTRRRGWGLYGATALTLVLALLSKPTTTPLPVALLLLDWWPLRRLSWRALAEKLPLLAIAVASGVITIVSQKRAARIILPTEYPPFHILLTICHNMVFYLYKLVWPTNLTSNYTFPEPLDLTHPMVLAGVIGTGVLLLILLISLGWTRAPAGGWLVFFVMLFPTLGIIGFTNIIASHKYIYIPVIGLLCVLTWALTNLWRALGRRMNATERGAVLLVPLALIGTLCGIASRAQLDQWKDTERLYRYMMQYGADYGLHTGLGYALYQKKDYARALAELRQAIALKPDYYVAYNNLGLVLAAQEKYDEALAAFQESVARDPKARAVGDSNIGRMYLLLNRPEDARTWLERALEKDPRAADVHISLGRLFAEQGKLADAEPHFRNAVKFAPNAANAHVGLAMVLQGQRRYDEAIAEAERAVRLAPQNDKFRRLLAALQNQRGLPRPASAPAGGHP